MKIVFISPGHPQYDAPPYLGGIQQQIWGLAEAFIRRGHEVHLVHRSLGRKGTPSPEAHVRSIGVPWSDEVFSVLIYSRIAAAVIDELRPDIFSLHERFSGFFPSRVRRHKVFFAHNPDAMRFYANFARSYRAVNWGVFPVKNWMEEECMRRCEMTFALNRRDQEYLESRQVGEVRRIRNAVDPSLYRPGRDEGFILFAGRLSRVKGIELVERMFERLARETEVDLHIAGNGPMLSQVLSWRAGAGLQDRVKILGWLRPERLREELARCSFLILPSLFETFGLVVLEAMACSKPVVASRIPGPEDILRHSETGFLFGSGDSDDFARCCRLLIHDKGLRLRLGRAGRSDVERHFSFETVSVQLLDLYTTILGGRKGG